MMNTLSAFIMRRPLNAAFVVFLIMWFFPIVNFVALVILALYTLREGLHVSLPVLGAAIVCISWTTLKGSSVSVPVTLSIIAIGNILLLWALAVLLRNTGNWSLVITIMIVCGAIVSVLFHHGMSEVLTWWHNHEFRFTWQGSDKIALFPQKYIEGASMIIAWLLSDFFLLFLARFWQAKLYNPGQLRPEVQRICLPRAMSTTFIALLLGAVFFKVSILFTIVAILGTGFLIAGMSLVHWYLYNRQAGRFWIIAFYVLMIFLNFYMVTLLVIVALVDSFLNLRNYFY